MDEVGEYIGAEELFRGKGGTIKPFGDVVKMQFDDGPDWMTQSWITFPAKDVSIEIQALDFGCDSMLTEKEKDDDGDTV